MNGEMNLRSGCAVEGQESTPTLVNVTSSDFGPSRKTESLRRLVHLDGLRGLAVFLVFFVHLHPMFSRFLTQKSFLQSFSYALASIGNAGVDLFFLLSGYLIYGLVLKRTKSYGAFLWRRIRRIYPTFIFVFSLYLLLSFVFPQESKLYGTALHKAAYIAANFFLLPGIFPIVPIITVAWSLSYEFFFYTFIPFFVRIPFVRSLTGGQRAFLLAGWWLIGMSVMRLLGLQRLQMFVVGILIYELSQIPSFTKRLSNRGEYLAIVMFLVALGSAYFVFVPNAELAATLLFARHVAFPLMSISFFCFGLYALVYAGLLHRFLTWLPIRFLGRISYSYYLIHGLTLKALALVLGIIMNRWRGNILFCAVSIVAFVLTCAAASVLFLLVEEPLSLHSESRLLKWWQDRRREAVASVREESTVMQR